MDNLIFNTPQLHKQRMQELMEEARIERLLNEKKRREATAWQQRQLHRNRKSN